MAGQTDRTAAAAGSWVTISFPPEELTKERVWPSAAFSAQRSATASELKVTQPFKFEV